MWGGEWFTLRPLFFPFFYNSPLFTRGGRKLGAVSGLWMCGCMLGLDRWDRGELALGRGFVDGDGRRGEGRAISRTG